MSGRDMLVTTMKNKLDPYNQSEFVGISIYFKHLINARNMENSKLLTFQSPPATPVCATYRNIKSPRILAKQCTYDPYGAHNKHRLFPQSTLMAYFLVNTSCVLGDVRTEVTKSMNARRRLFYGRLSPIQITYSYNKTNETH